MMRTQVFKALVGSHNYNLNTPSSDKDYKVFVLPTFEDLYTGKMYANQTITETEDHDVHDIRKLANLFYKANLNYIEVLYSKDFVVNENLSEHQKSLFNELMSHKKEIVKMNLPYLYNACGGMYYNKMKLLYKGTEGTQHLVDKFGYDTKQAQHAYRSINFIERFANTNFEDFKSAMTYEGKDKEFMLEIKDGFFKPENFEQFVTFYHDSRFKGLKEKYHSQKVNEELRIRIDQIVMELVKSNAKEWIV